MKKLRNILASVMAMAIVGSIGTVNASAKTYIEIDENGTPTQVIEFLTYRGIVVTMHDSTAPAIDEIGVECEISEYNAESLVVGYEDDTENDERWLITPTVSQKENQFYLNFRDSISEEEAFELAEKLMIRGIAQNAELLYDYRISHGAMKVFESQHQIYLTFKEGTDIGDTDLLEAYPEIKEMLSGYSSFKAENYGDAAYLYFGLDDSDYIKNQTSPYSDILSLEKALVSKYEEIDSIDIPFVHLTSGNESSNAVYSVVPTWGDATNDDIINLYDAIEISKHIMGIGELDEDTILLADINRDGETNLYDAVEIAKSLM